ncbi:glycosyltransferase [Patescibacteria group bacterium]|nr:glycosyltransferase [Patescibacteria group bacterium]MBU1683169.1 glycosyltransferase [Patescibacteria group bacterium]MBU1934425.1 glycosyltransferase [Patescibacteria group bacterium]
MKIAIVTDWLTNYGGAESVISAFHDLFPDAPIYTTMYKPEKMRELGKLKNVKTTWLNKIPFVKHQWMLSLMPTAVEMMDLSDYDIVLSSCHSVSKGVITKPDALHISYCHTPMRYAWESWDFETRLKKFPRILHKSIRKQIKVIREWDYCAAQRVDQYIANSSHIGNQIKKYYKRNSDVIYPPVHTEKFKPISNPTEDFYLAVGRLIPYKKFDLIVQTFNKLKKPVKIVGTGPQLEKIKDMAKDNVEVLGYVDDKKLIDLYANCKAFLFPQLEDAGIVPLEAMAAGRPVIALNRGGSLDTMIDGKTGVLFKEQTVKSLSDAIKKFEKMKFDPKFIRKHAEKYDVEIFKEKIKDYVEKEWEKFNLTFK